MAPHILVVGGTGMLSGLSKALAENGGRLSLVSRRASEVGGFDADYHDAEAFSAALAAAVARFGPIDLAVAWFHTLKIPAPRLLAEQVHGRMFQVLGSAVADPAHPGRLQTAAEVAAGLADCALRQVVLGFVVDGAGSRWLNNAEISAGVLQAIDSDAVLSIVGQTAPWSARP